MNEFPGVREPRQPLSDEPLDRRFQGENDLGDGAEQRSDEQRQLDEERRARRAYHVQAAFWSVMGAFVVLYLFFAFLGAVDPVKAPGATIVILVVALIWLAHAWERLYRGGHVSRSDRERRGF